MKKILLLALLGFFAINVTAQDFTKIAIINAYPDVASIEDDDEKAAAEWLVGKGGSYKNVSDLTGASDLAGFNSVWIYLSKTITDPEPATVFKNTYLAPFTAPTALNAITDYYKGGGNLYLTTHALYYLTNLGRVDADPDIVAFGPGGGAATFFIGATWGTWFDQSIVIDKTEDKVYEDMVYVPATKLNGHTYNIYPLLGEGHKEDHNCFWSMAAPAKVYDNGNVAQYVGFESMWGAENLGTWDHIQDYCGAALVRFNPMGDYKGKAIAMGVGAYEFNQNDHVNVFQDNVEQLTSNILKELSPDIYDSVESNMNNDDYSITVKGGILEIESQQNIPGIQIINLSGQTVMSALNTTMLDINSLSKGVYVVQLSDNGKNVYYQKIIK